MNLQVFISYSWDSIEHTNWVNRLSSILRQNGINALVDQISVQPGNNLEKYMTEGISDSRWVICVISEEYIEKMNNLTSGVGREVEIIKNRTDLGFIIPILKNNPSKTIPDIFKSIFYLNFDEGNENVNLEMLIKRLYCEDKKFTPEIIEKPFNKLSSHSRILSAMISKTTYINPALSGNVSFDYSNNDGVYNIGTGEYKFVTSWSKASNLSIHVYNHYLGSGGIALLKSLNSFDDFCDSEDLDFTSRTRCASVGDGIIWINDYGNMAITKISKILDNSRGDQNDLLEFEYIILYKPR